MSASKWELEVTGGGKKEASAWGFSGLKLRVQSLAQDSAEWISDLQDWTSPVAIAKDSDIKVYQNGRATFAARVITVPREGGHDYERHTYQAVGPWYWFEHLVFQQIQMWKFLIKGTTTIEYEDNSHLLLNLNTNLSKVKTDVQIRAVLDYAIARGAPFQYAAGNITPSVDVPVQEVRDWTCAQVIRQQLRFSPDAVSWFDYSTTPPTFYCKRRSELSDSQIKGLNPNAGTLFSKLRLSPRYDLQIPSVSIRYERADTATIDGVTKTYNIRTVDNAGGDGTELKALVATLELKGQKVTGTTSKLLVRQIDATDPASWKALQPYLTDSRYSNVQVTGGDEEWPDFGPSGPGISLPNQIVEGHWQSWMSGIHAARVHLKADASYTYTPTDGSQPLHNVRTKPLRAKIIATDAPVGTNTFEKITSLDYAEPTPNGLAAYLLSTLNVLQYEGSLEFTEEECSQSWLGLLGKKINFQNSDEFGSMNAVPQIVEQDIDSGTTLITIGPAHQLGVQDLMEWLRGIRAHRPAINFTNMEGTDNAGNSVDFELHTGSEDTEAGEAERNLLELRNDGDVSAPYDATSPYTRQDLRPVESIAGAQIHAYHPGVSGDLSLIAPDGTVPAGWTGKGIVMKTIDCIDANVDGVSPAGRVPKPHVIKIRQMAVCDKGKTRYILGPFSEVYDVDTV